MERTYESLAEYIEVNCAKSLSSIILDYFKDNQIYVTNEEYNNPELYGFKIKLAWEVLGINYFKAPEYNLDFDMLINTCVEITDYVGDELVTNRFFDKYTVSMTGVLHKGLHDLVVHKIYEGDQRREFDHKNSLSEFLTPYINKDEYEEYALQFLNIYFKEGIESPTFVAPPIILKRMGLNVCFGPLDNDVNGKIIFSEQNVAAYNFDTKRVETKLVPAGTILINYDILASKGMGCLNNTAIHECVHWWLHKKYFELQLLLNPNDPSSNVFVDEMEIPDMKKFKNKYFMELQARSIAPMILMPELATRNKYESIIDKLESRKSYYNKKKTYLYAMYKVANCFGASVQSTIIRLENLGYTELSFTRYLSNSTNVKPFKTSKHLRPGQTYLVEFEDAAKAIANNEKLHNAFVNGQFVFVDGLFVLNDEKYVKKYKNGHSKLTDEALSDVSKCCLLFDTVAESVTINYDPTKFNYTTFCSGGSQNEYNRIASINDDSSQELIKKNGLGLKFKEELDEALEFIAKMNRYSSFFEKMDCLLGDECYGFKSNRYIASKSGISDKTIAAFRRGDSIPNEKQLLAICSGLKFHPKISHYLFSAGRMDIFSTNEEPYPFYVVLLETCASYGRDVWNSMIKEVFPQRLEYII